jgi:hypothetical protein
MTKRVRVQKQRFQTSEEEEEDEGGGSVGKKEKKGEENRRVKKDAGRGKEMMNKDTKPCPILKTCVSDVRRMFVVKLSTSDTI